MNEKFSVYGRLARDPEISHGAFRLWHILRDHADANGECFPGQRALQKDIHCSMSRIKIWISQLVAGGYLTANVRDGALSRYVILIGNAAGKRRMTKQDAPAVSTTGNGAFPKVETVSVSSCGNVSNTSEVKSRSKGQAAPRLFWQLRIDKKETEQLLQDERNSTRPDRELIHSLKAELSKIHAEMKAQHAAKFQGIF